MKDGKSGKTSSNSNSNSKSNSNSSNTRTVVTENGTRITVPETIIKTGYCFDY